jgi:hypothetical protein
MYMKKTKTIWNIDKAKDIALLRDPLGSCLSLEYNNMHTPLLWKCSNPLHPPFKKELNSVYRRGSWCAKCWDEKRNSGVLSKINISDIRILASEREGELLSLEYKYGNKLEWRCKYGHVFERTYNEVKQRNRWCDKCNNVYRSQELTRLILNTILKTSFCKTRLKSIGIREGGQLEYDGYSPRLKMAFEYNGEFHYHKKASYIDLSKIQENDRKKSILSEKHGIRLIVIPYFSKTSNFDPWKYIESILDSLNIAYEPYSRNISLSAVFYSDYYNEIKALVELKGGRLISYELLNATKKIAVECEQKHVFYISPHKLKSGKWCRHAMRNREFSLEEIMNTIIHYGGEFISMHSIDGVRYITCKCEEGHVFNKRMGDIRQGYWCNDINHKDVRRKPKYLIRNDKYSINESL